MGFWFIKQTKILKNKHKLWKQNMNRCLQNNMLNKIVNLYPLWIILLCFMITKFLGYPISVSRTLSVEVGMQNGGLAAVLAKQNFPLYPFTAVPAVFSSIVQTLVGGFLAAYWRSRPEKRPKTGSGETIIKRSVSVKNSNII